VLLATFCASVVAEHTVFHRQPQKIEATYMVGAIDILDDHLPEKRVELRAWGGVLSTSYYPPLYLWSLVAAFRHAGIEYDSALWINLPLAILALLSVYGAGALLGNRWTGLAGTLVLWAAPGFRDGAAGIYIDHAMTCLIAAAFLFFAAFQTRRSWPGWFHLLGFAGAVAAGLYTRWTFAVFLGPLLLAPLLTAVPGPWPARWRSLRGGLGLGLAGAVGCIPFVHWLLTVADLEWLRSTPTSEAVVLSTLETLIHYPALLLDQGLGWGLGVLALASILHPRIWTSRKGWPLLLWLVVGLAFFTWLPPKKPRYMLFLLPCLALLTGLAIHRTPWPKVRRWLVGVTAGVAVATAGITVATRPTLTPGFHEAILSDIDRSWDEQERHGVREPRILVHDVYSPPEGDVNAIVLMAHNAVQARPVKNFSESFHASRLVFRDECVIEGDSIHYVLFAFEYAQLDPAEVESLPFFECLDLELLGSYPMAEYTGAAAEARLFRFVRLNRDSRDTAPPDRRRPRHPVP